MKSQVLSKSRLLQGSKDTAVQEILVFVYVEKQEGLGGKKKISHWKSYFFPSVLSWIFPWILLKKFTCFRLTLCYRGVNCDSHCFLIFSVSEAALSTYSLCIFLPYFGQSACFRRWINYFKNLPSDHIHLCWLWK